MRVTLAMGKKIPSATAYECDDISTDSRGDWQVASRGVRLPTVSHKTGRI